VKLAKEAAFRLRFRCAVSLRLDKVVPGNF